MSEEPMLERVARAIEGGDGHDPSEQVFTPDGMSSRWKLAMPAARAAIEAMREPNSEIHAAMVKECGADARGAWYAGIDAALEGK